MKNLLLTFFLLAFLASRLCAGDSATIKVWFLYGSRPKKEWKSVESKWFGGIHGGHVGISTDSSGVKNFLPCGKFHIFPQKKIIQGCFDITPGALFDEFFSSSENASQILVIEIPVSLKQKNKVDSLYAEYVLHSPYDYAFFGIRCASSACDILQKASILPNRNKTNTVIRNFYPKKLRKRLLKKAKKNEWNLIRIPGSNRRIWEKDS